MEKHFGLIVASREKILYVSEAFMQETFSGANQSCLHPDDTLDLSKILNGRPFAARLKIPGEDHYTRFIFNKILDGHLTVVCFAPEKEAFFGNEDEILQSPSCQTLAYGLVGGNILNSFPDALFLVDDEGKIADYKIPTSMVPDMPWSKLCIGKKISEMLPAGTGENFTRFAGRAIQTGRAEIFEYSLGAGQEKKHFEARFSKFTDCMALILVRDTSKKKRLFEDMLSQKEKYSNFFTHAPEPYITLSFPGRKIIDVSLSFTELFGYSVKDAGGKTPEDLELWVNGAEKEKYLSMLAKNGSVTNFEAMLYNKSRDAVPVLISSHMVQTDDGKNYLTLVRDISSQKLAQMKLEESEKRHRKLVEGIGVPVFVHDGEKFLFSNDEFADFIGLPKQEIDKKDLYGLVIPELRAEFAFKVNRALAGDILPARCDIRFICAQNNIKIARTCISGGTYSGKPCAYVSITDLTSLMKTQEALKSANEFLGALVASTKDIVLAFDVSGKCIFAKIKPEWINYENNTFLGKDIGEIFGSGDSSGALQAMISDVARSGIQGKFAGHFKILGREAWLDTRCSPFSGPQGEIIGTVSLMKDITSNLADRQKILEGQNRLDSILANISDIVFEVRDGVVSYISPNLARTLGKSVGDFVGHKVTEFVSPWKALRVQRSARESKLTVRLADQDGETRTFEVKLSFIGNSYIGVARDITESIQKEEARRVFLGSVAHELRNPLTVISGFSELLEGMIGDNPAALEVVRMIRESALREQRHVDDLVNFGMTKPRYIFRLVDAYGLFIGLHARLKVLFEELLGPDHTKLEAKFLINVDGNLKGKTIKADIETLTEVFGNLLTNAIKYSRQDRPLEVKLDAKVDDNAILASFSDNGIGIPKSKQNLIFKPFYQVSPASEPKNGMGMGLSIVKMHVESHGGFVWFSNNEKSGTTFFVKLPLVP